MGYTTIATKAKGSVVVMQLSRQSVVDVLRRTGLPDIAEEAARILPDTVDVDQLAEWGQRRYGITKDYLISLIGGSP